MSETRDTHAVGWCEYVDLPEWGVTGIRAKTDTGARTCSLHVENLKRLKGGRVAFDVLVKRASGVRRVRVRTRLARSGHVKSSNGEARLRPFVVTTLRIGPVEREVEINLVDRGSMRHPMLLGRTALPGLLVDVRRRYLLGKRPRRRKKQHEEGGS